jgi:hypothetical protein
MPTSNTWPASEQIEERESNNRKKVKSRNNKKNRNNESENIARMRTVGPGLLRDPLHCLQAVRGAVVIHCEVASTVASSCSMNISEKKKKKIKKKKKKERNFAFPSYRDRSA